MTKGQRQRLKPKKDTKVSTYRFFGVEAMAFLDPLTSNSRSLVEEDKRDLKSSSAMRSLITNAALRSLPVYPAYSLLTGVTQM